MDIWAAFQALILGIVEGLTEFLPISSTGHLIVAGDLLDFNGQTATAFKIIIQLGAILAVMWEFREKIFSVVLGLPSERKAQRFTGNLLIAFIPALIIGPLLADLIEHWLFNPITVASALIVGGVIMIWAEKREHVIKAESVDDMTWSLALKVGLAQCVAMIPGTSRSGATIIGGLVFGLSRKAATEFSFFLAMPTMVAATAYSCSSTATSCSGAICRPFSSVSLPPSSWRCSRCARCSGSSPITAMGCSPGIASPSVCLFSPPGSCI